MPDGDAVHPQSVVGATGRGLAVRARHRHSPRDGSLLVEPVRADVCRGDQETTGSSRLVFELALAPGRGFREDQWRDALPLACRRLEGEILEVFALKRRDRKAALQFPRRVMIHYGRPNVIVIDRLPVCCQTDTGQVYLANLDSRQTRRNW
jgi:hypothetical protein